MEAKWLEDFVVLAETRSFSRAAQMRHITQPAFSRRIQALEAWLGQDLIDRATYPPGLTTAGEAFYRQAQDLLNRINSLRTTLNDEPSTAGEVVSFALPHTLALNFFPQWLAGVKSELGPVNARMRVGNVLDVVLWLVEGACDVLVCFHHPQQPVQLDPERFDVLRIDTETLAPYAPRDGNGRPQFGLPGQSHKPVPYLAYSSSAYLARMADIALRAGRARPHLSRVFDTDLADLLKDMALAGHGVAFLPARTAAAAERDGRLARIDGGWEVEMEIRAYRERPTIGRPASRLVEQLWQLLEARAQRMEPLSAARATPRRRGAGRR
jgi:DNA-binding transcriptional LysR family regulator